MHALLGWIECGRSGVAGREKVEKSNAAHMPLRAASSVSMLVSELFTDSALLTNGTIVFHFMKKRRSEYKYAKRHILIILE